MYTTPSGETLRGWIHHSEYLGESILAEKIGYIEPFGTILGRTTLDTSDGAQSCSMLYSVTDADGSELLHDQEVIDRYEPRYNAIGAISSDSDAGPNLYYNLTGARVSAGTCCPGLYIRVSSGKAEKVYIR